MLSHSKDREEMVSLEMGNMGGGWGDVSQPWVWGLRGTRSFSCSGRINVDLMASFKLSSRSESGGCLWTPSGDWSVGNNCPEIHIKNTSIKITS